MRLDLQLFCCQVKSRCPVETVVIQQGHRRHLQSRTHCNQFLRRRSATKETERRPRMKLDVLLTAHGLLLTLSHRFPLRTIAHSSNPGKCGKGSHSRLKLNRAPRRPIHLSPKHPSATSHLTRAKDPRRKQSRHELCLISLDCAH